MNEQIKHRITQLNNGEVPNGYEKTEFGIFPCDWVKDKTFGDLFDFYGGLGKSRDELGDEGHAYLHYGDLHRGSFNVVSHEQYDQLPKYDVVLKGKETYLMEDGDVAFLDASEDLDGTSRSVLVDNPDNKPFIAGLHIIFGKSKDNSLEKWYKQYITSSESVRKQFQRLAAGFKVYGVNRDTLPRIQVAYPKSTEEQSKIAEILMKWDEAIELQKQYITKIILRNGAVVDKLLSSKDNWKPLPLSTFVELKNGYAFKSETYINEGKYKIITIKNVKSGEFDLTECCTIDELPNNLQTHQLLSMGDIIISLTGNVGRACIVNAENCLLNQRVGKIVVKTISPVFIYEILQTNRFVSKMQNIAQGCAQANLSNSDVEDFVAFFPYDGDGLDIRTIDKISCILSEFRNELVLQKELLNKLLLQRKALQQYLLNGIVRV